VRSAFAALLVTAIATGWFGLSLLPALRELLVRTDVEPLQLTRGAGDIRHFSISFRRFVNAELPGLAQHVSSTAGSGEHGFPASLRDGARAWYIPAQGDYATAVELHGVSDLSERVVISEAGLVIPSGTVLLKELFVDSSLRGGHGAVYRAALVTGDATLGSGSSVLRWIDADGNLEVGESCVLHGRASAYGTVTLERGVRFQRIAAPRIRVAGSPAARPSPAWLEAGEPALAWDAVPVIQRMRTNAMRDTVSLEMLVPPEGAKVSFGRWLIDGDFTVPAGATVDSDLIISGVLKIGEGATVRGAVKSATLIGEDRVVYLDAIVATSRLALGAGSKVVGPVVVEGEAVVGEGCRVGGPGDETTISAVSVRLGAGAEVYGEIWAREWAAVDL
jgi:predicted acyltransferase (DUF342 family)